MITVAQFIGINDILKATHYESDIERDIALMSFLSGKPESYYETLTLAQLRDERDKIAVPDINNTPKAKPYIKANGRTYAPVFLFNELTAAQYIDATSFMKDEDAIIDNLPQILASICVPTKRTLRGRKRLAYMSRDHREVAKDMEQADIMEAYAIALFFSTVLNAFLETTGGYLAAEMVKLKAETKTTLSEAEKKALSLITVAFGDGTIPPGGSPIMTA